MFKYLVLSIFFSVYFILNNYKAEATFWDGLVNIDRSSDDGNRKVGVHLPFIYWMDLNQHPDGPKLDLSVLGGLVKVNVDRKESLKRRPVMVRVFGQNIYNSFPKKETQLGQASVKQPVIDKNVYSKPNNTGYSEEQSQIIEKTTQLPANYTTN